MATIVYCHGFASVGGGWKADRLREAFPEHTVLSPTLPAQPMRALDVLQPVVSASRSYPVILVGTSLGGFYAHYVSQVFDVPCVLVNPCTRPSQYLSQYVGRAVKNHVTGEPIELSQADMTVFQALERGIEVFRNGKLVNVLVAEDDDVIDCHVVREDIKFTNSYQVFPTGGHRFESQWDSVTATIKRVIEMSNV